MEYSLIATLAALAALAFFAYRNHKLEQRCSCLRYSWLAMKSFAEMKVFKEDDFDHQWRDLIIEHQRLMARFGMALVQDEEAHVFEALLDAKGIKPLEQHARYR